MIRGDDVDETCAGSQLTYLFAQNMTKTQLLLSPDLTRRNKAGTAD